MVRDPARWLSFPNIRRWLFRSWKYLTLSLLIFTLVSLVWWRISITYENNLLELQRASLQMRVNGIGNSLSSIVTQRQAMLDGLAAFVKTHSIEGLRNRYFDIYAAGLKANDPVIRAIQYMPVEGPILVYPLEGNEAIANLTLENHRNDDRAYVRADVERAIASRKITLSNPYELRQGGKGVVARLAVYDQETFLGLAVVVLDLEPLLAIPGLFPLPADFHFAIKDAQQQVFFGEDWVFSSNPISTEIELPEGAWTLAIVPQDHWTADIRAQMIVFWSAGLLLALLVAGVTYILAIQQFSLSETVQVQSEELIQRGEKLRLAVEASGIGFFDWDTRTDQVSFSPEWKRQIGYAVDEIRDDHVEWSSRIHPEDFEKTMALLNNSIQSHAKTYEAEFRLRHKDGSYRWILARGSFQRNAAGELEHMQGCHIDVTKLKQYEIALSASERRLRLFVEHAPAAIAMFDQEMNYIAVSRRFLTDYRLTEQNIVGRSHYEIFPDIPPRWKEIHQRCLAGAIETAEEDPFPRADGRVDWIRWEIHPWYEESGTIGGIILFSEVITERKHAQEQIARLLERFALATRAAHFGIWDWDIVNNQAIWDDSLYELYGIDRADFSGSYEFWRNSLAPEDRARSEETLQQALRGEREYDDEFPIIRPDGSKRWLRAIGQILHGADGKPQRMIGINYDITERKQAEEALRRANEELKIAYDATLQGWSHALELRERETAGHSQRVVEWTLRLAQAMGICPEDMIHLQRGALLHDIGKMGIPDHILLKPGPLTKEEWEIMQRHPIYSYQLLSKIPYLTPALDIPHYHHERWDGLGYPNNLIGEAIPIAARIFAIVDVWDALSSDRPYRPAWTREAIIDYLKNQSGKQFDPQVVEIFLQLIEQNKAEL